MILKCLAALALAATLPAVTSAQSAAAPLVVTAVVVRSCRVTVPAAAQPSELPSVPVSLACVKSSGAAARVQRPVAPRRIDARGEIVVINF